MNNIDKMTQLEQNILNIAKDSLDSSFKEAFKGWNSPSTLIVKEVINEHSHELKSIFNKAFTNIINSKEFAIDIREQFKHKVAKMLVSDLTGCTEKAVNAVRSDPTLKARMILAVEEIINDNSK